MVGVLAPRAADAHHLFAPREAQFRCKCFATTFAFTLKFEHLEIIQQNSKYRLCYAASHRAVENYFGSLI